jgi:hypothetical protein
MSGYAPTFLGPALKSSDAADRSPVVLFIRLPDKHAATALTILSLSPLPIAAAHMAPPREIRGVHAEPAQDGHLLIGDVRLEGGPERATAFLPPARVEVEELDIETP